MKQIARIEIEIFLRKEGYEISNRVCSEEETKIYECWIKNGTQKIKLTKGVKYFQSSQLSSIFHDNRVLSKFKLTL